VVFRSVANRSELFAVLAELGTSVAATRLNPILDIESHGDNDLGLQLTDGSWVSWIAPTGSIDEDVLEPGLRAFYADLFASFDITSAIDALRAAAPEFGYMFKTAHGLFETCSQRRRHG
jgi:hypothetical protein